MRISDWSSDVCSSDLEDVGLADPAALPQTVAAWQAFERIGSPEGELALAQAVIYLATAPKSNAAYKAFGAAQRVARDSGSLAATAHILNAPTRLMKEIGRAHVYTPVTNAPIVSRTQVEAENTKKTTNNKDELR